LSRQPSSSPHTKVTSGMSRPSLNISQLPCSPPTNFQRHSKSVHCQLAEASLTYCFPTAPKRMSNSDKLDILYNRRKHMVLYIFHLYKTDVSVYWSTIHSCRSTNPNISTISTNMSTTSTNIVKRTHDGAGRILELH